MPRLKRRGDRHLDVTEPELEAIATGASRCAASNRPILSLSRTFDHDTSRTSLDLEALGRGKSLLDGNDQSGGVDQRDEADLERARHFRSSDAVTIDWAISPIFFFSRIAVDRSKT